MNAVTASCERQFALVGEATVAWARWCVTAGTKLKAERSNSKKLELGCLGMLFFGIAYLILAPLIKLAMYVLVILAGEVVILAYALLWVPVWIVARIVDALSAGKPRPPSHKGAGDAALSARALAELAVNRAGCRPTSAARPGHDELQERG